MNALAQKFARRSILGAGLVGAIAPVAVRTAQARAGRFDRAAYNRYIGLMNSGDARFLDYYADDVVFVMGLRGIENVRGFYARQQPFVKEKLEVVFFCADEMGAAAQVLSEIQCVRDCDDPTVFGRPLRAGEKQIVRGCILYVLNAHGKIAEVKGPPPEVIRPWSIAPI